jgi:ParB-like chromosome segregation protein Spo0J
MEIRILPIEQINAATYNPRVDLQPDDAEYEKLNQSIEAFGYIDPIVWNERTDFNPRTHIECDDGTGG